MWLHDACDLALRTRWAHLRKLPTYRGWCDDLTALWPDKRLETISAGDVRTLVGMLQMDGLAPATVYARVSHLSAIYTAAREQGGYNGPRPEPMPYPHVPRTFKWWLNETMASRVYEWLDTNGHADVARFVRWTVLTGLRIEETLRVTRDMLFMAATGPCLHVPGTKTDDAEATLAISPAAYALALEMLGSGDRLVTLSYREIITTWTACRKALGLMDVPTATPKALRRTYARDRFAAGAPLPVVQQLMRHRDPNTTLGYIRLTGGAFTAEEVRRWV